jgi:ArsR family transcriptional regulator, arsenate/arsenite/antimonite-responsive transcriptional repressor
MTERLAGLLGTLGEPNRLEICRLLARRPATISDLVDELGLSQPLVSHHVKRLREGGLIETLEPSRRSPYRVKPQILEGISRELWLLASRARRVGGVAGPRRRR